MGVNHSSYVFSMIVDSEMHADLTGHVPRASKQPTVEIHNHHVIRFEQVLAHAGGRDKQTMFVQSGGQIARCSRSEPEPRKPSTKEDKIPSQLSFCSICTIH
jgi:hypothetical protein